MLDDPPRHFIIDRAAASDVNIDAMDDDDRVLPDDSQPRERVRIKGIRESGSMLLGTLRNDIAAILLSGCSSAALHEPNEVRQIPRDALTSNNKFGKAVELQIVRLAIGLSKDSLYRIVITHCPHFRSEPTDRDPRPSPAVWASGRRALRCPSPIRETGHLPWTTWMNAFYI